MRFNHRSPFHWLVVAVVAIVALFTFSPARGHDPGAPWGVHAPGAGASVALAAQAGEWDYSRPCKIQT